ncbi:hypothetical protein [Cryobacterium sp. 10C3]|uniref:hypothetical protein n=1 Tax=Cryobacterium sp. 10C3 TaxID=3048577 RepID=UPI002AB38E20|nr:hypothetical protein [Cryobacterium sp. 10C3]MDY7558013.1 hypothetical protein [Cryobacterium sp. 10C3]
MSATEQPGNDIAPVQPAPGTAVPEILVGQAAATVRRSPRYLNFMIVGAVLGAVTALILTVGFPRRPNSDSSRSSDSSSSSGSS